METVRSTYTLDATRFDQALAILQREQQANTPSRQQEIVFMLLNIAVYGFGIVLGIIVAVALLSLLALIFSEEWATIFFWIVIILLFVLYIPLIAAAVGIAILFFLNLPLIRKLWRQNRLVHRLGLSEALKAPWQAVRKKKRLRNILTLIVGGLGLLLMVGGLIFGVQFAKGVDWSAGEDVLFFVSALLLLITVGAALIATHFMRRGKEQLEVVARLQSSLAGYKEAAEQAEGTPIDIPAEEYEQIAQIERAQISRHRAQSIQAGFEEPGAATYLVQKSRTVRSAQAQLDPMTRLRVQNQIDALTTEPRPSGATEDPKTKTWRLRVPETSVEIDYSVDDATQRIKIFFLRSVTDDQTPNSEHGG